MKNLITILCLCLFSGCSVYTEEETLLNKIESNNIYKNGRYYYRYIDVTKIEIINDKHYLYDNNNRLLFEVENFIDGKEYGRFVEYFKGGSKKREGYYINGLPNGKWSYYSTSSSLIKEENYLEGKKTGKWLKFSGSSLIKEENYLEGKKTGKWLEFSGSLLIKESIYEKDNLVKETKYKDGYIFYEKNYIDGYQDGKSITYHKNDDYSKRWTEETWVSGKKSGKHITYSKFSSSHGENNIIKEENYNNGILRSEYHFKNQDSTKIIMYNSQKQKHGFFKEKHKHTISTSFHIIEGYYKDGLKDGEWRKKWYEDPTWVHYYYKTSDGKTEKDWTRVKELPGWDGNYELDWEEITIWENGKIIKDIQKVDYESKYNEFYKKYGYYQGSF